MVTSPKRLAPAAAVALTAILVLQVGLDGYELLDRASLGTMANGVVGRDPALRSAEELRPFDLVRAVRGCREPSWGAFGESRPPERGCSVELEVMRDGQEVHLELTPRRWTAGSLVAAFGPAFLSGLLLLVTTALLLGRAARDPARGAVLLLTGILGVHQLTALDVNWVHRFDRLHLAAESLLPFVLAHLALTFPRPFQVVRDAPYAVAPLYGTGLAVLIVEQALWLSFPERWILIARIVELLTLIAGLWVLGRVVAALGSLSQGRERYRARVLLYGVALAFGVPAVFFLVDLTARANLAGAVLPFSWAVIPISVGLAVGRRDLFALHDRYRGFLLPAGATAACVFGVFFALVGVFRLLGFDRPLVEPAFGITLVVSTALLLEGGRRVALRSLEHLLPSPESRFRRLLEQAAEADPSPASWGGTVEFLLGYLMRELRPAFAVLIHVDPECQRLRLFRARGALPTALRQLDLGLESVVAERLLGASTYAGHPDLSEEERREWRSYGLEAIELTLPLRTGSRALGTLVLGGTRGALSRSDVEFLRLLAQAAALGLRSSRRLEETERRLRERSRALAEALERLRQDEGEPRAPLEAQERFAWIGKLAAGVAHEASKPLYIIRHHLARLMREAGGDARRLHAIATEVNHVGRLIGDLQAYARSHVVSRESVPIRSLLEEVAQERGRSLDLEIAGDLALETRADPALLLTLFRNLFENAREAGAERLTVELAHEAGDVVVRVADDGPGVPAGLEERVFEPFFSTKQAGRASGLGLAIAREIARSHGGTLALRCGTPGTTFELRLPHA